MLHNGILLALPQVVEPRNRGTTGRLPALDVLRAIAIFLVLGRHMPDVVAHAEIGPLAAFFQIWQRGGWIGVDLFFVLSGFLIAGLLFSEQKRFGKIRYGRFLARRGFKIYPAFYFMLFSVVWFAAACRHTFVSSNILLSEILFVQNFGPRLFPHTWSLAVEEHFYLVLPLFLILLRGSTEKPFRFLPATIAAISVVVLAVRFAIPDGQTHWEKTHLFPTYLRIDSLLFGVFLSWCFHFHREKLQSFVRRYRLFLSAAAVILLLPPFLLEIGPGDKYLHTFGLTAHALGSGAVLLLALSGSWHSRPLGFIGTHSYSIYLWHMPIRFFGVALLPTATPPLPVFLAYLVFSVVAGVVAARLIERPFLALRDRLLPSRAMSASQSDQISSINEPMIVRRTMVSGVCETAI